MHRYSNLAVNPWILDSGDSNHMAPHKYLLHNLQPLSIPFLITLPNGYKVKVVSTGSLQLRDGITLPNVLLVPSFHFNFQSIFQLLTQLNCLAVFSTFVCHLQGPYLKRPLEIGKASDGLYYYSVGSTQSSCSSLTSFPNFPSHSNVVNNCDNNVTSSCNTTYSFLNNSTHSNNNNNNKLDFFWHQRLGHMPYQKMKLLPVLHSKIPFQQSFLCDVYPKARQHGLFSPLSRIHTIVPFQLVHIDIWGSYHTRTYNGF